MARHPNKHIREAISYAEERGWRFTKASGRVHIFGTLWCARGERDGCRFRVYSRHRETRKIMHGESVVPWMDVHTEGANL